MTYFNVGESVRVAGITCMGGRRETPEGLKTNKIYRITDINRGIDGAYDWDDLILEGIKGEFCEFDFELVGANS